MTKIRSVVIMAGGSGERFYPASRLRKPKQLLRLVDDNKTMIEEAVDRITPLIPVEHIFIITSELLQDPIRRALPHVPPENVVAEPSKKNTAPCLALICTHIEKHYANRGYSPQDISVAVLTADHFMRPAEAFRSTVEIALKFVEEVGDIVTIGIVPTRPETGYGYIHTDQSSKEPVKKVLGFKEKPSKETALSYIADPAYYWNSGMFFWRLDGFFRELALHAPEIYSLSVDLGKQFVGKTSIVHQGAVIGTSEIYHAMPSISIDYALMEKSKSIWVVPSSFSWDDVGSWDALFRTKESDNNGNVIMGEVIMIESKDCVIVNEQKQQNIIACVGLENTVIVATDDVTVVCSVEQVQNVKKIVETLRHQNKMEYL